MQFIASPRQRESRIAWLLTIAPASPGQDAQAAKGRGSRAYLAGRRQDGAGLPEHRGAFHELKRPPLCAECSAPVLPSAQQAVLRAAWRSSNTQRVCPAENASSVQPATLLMTALSFQGNTRKQDVKLRKRGIHRIRNSEGCLQI